jgi:geranylgeranyl diphosphate synthase type II
VAILSGDAMSNLSYLYLLKTQSSFLNEILTLFSQTAMQVCEGQQYDMDFETSMNVSIADYMEMIRLKTAVLIACSLKTGALIGNAPAKEASCLYDFGINLGLAFQLQDDLLDIYASEDKFGKKIGGDIIANKKTFLLLKSLELANTEQKNELLRWLSVEKCNHDEKVNAVRKIFDETGVRKITREIMYQYYRKAVAELDAMTLQVEQKEKLYRLAKQIMKRNK